MNQCAFSRQGPYVKNFSQTVNQRSRLEDILASFYLPNAKLEFNSHDASNDWLSCGSTCAQGWRTQQEDAHLCDLNFGDSENLALFAVFDGHNGFEVAQYAAQMLPEYIQANKYFHKQKYVRTLEQSFLEFDKNLLNDKSNQDLNYIRVQYQRSNVHLAGRRRNQSSLVALNAGCTAVVALLDKSTQQFYVANIGDSRCVLCVKGKIIPLSKDHKPNDDVEKRRIERAGCHVVNGRINQGLNLSRAFGDHVMKNNSQLSACEQAVSPFPDVIVCKEKIRPGDSFMVLACDGIWNSMETQKVMSLVRKCIKKGMKLSKVCEEVVRRCISPVRPVNGQNGGDNMTCVVVRFDREIH